MDIPLALLESMAAGVPAVVCSTGPLGELVTAGAAWGAPQRDTERLANLTLRLLKEPALHRQAASEARRWWLREASPGILATRHRALYHELSKHRREHHER